MTVTLNLKARSRSRIGGARARARYVVAGIPAFGRGGAATQPDSFRHRSIARRVAQTGSPTPLQAGNSQKRSAKVQCRCSSSTNISRKCEASFGGLLQIAAADEWRDIRKYRKAYRKGHFLSVGTSPSQLVATPPLWTYRRCQAYRQTAYGMLTGRPGSPTNSL